MQPYIDWETIEGKNCGSFKYQILRAVNTEGDVLYKGFIVYSDNSTEWFENDKLDVVRLTLITMGQQR